uniref:Uncharacterized protein n=1 Tax=Branchiostoma floridae TaxID=7739 RepID=C3YEH3_BRAFL|eukprot:XP_002605265.1 hypothetical protein BRAFLDRAFT_95902 [Branchiostoma floridae]
MREGSTQEQAALGGQFRTGPANIITQHPVLIASLIPFLVPPVPCPIQRLLVLSWGNVTHRCRRLTRRQHPVLIASLIPFLVPPVPCPIQRLLVLSWGNVTHRCRRLTRSDEDTFSTPRSPCDIQSDVIPRSYGNGTRTLRALYAVPSP